MDSKSRFPGLRLFRINSASGHNSHTGHSQPPPLSSLPPPHPPPTAYDSNSGFFMYTSTIGAASTPDLSYNSMRSPSSDYPRFQSPVSPFLQQTPASSSQTSYLASPATALRKSLTKLSSLGRRGTKSANIPHSPSLNVLPECNDEGISAPYNFQHNIHVNDSLQGMPPSWFSTLLAAGFTQEEIDNLRVVRNQRVATQPITATSTRDHISPIMATFPAVHQNTTSLSQFGELYHPPPRMNTSSQTSQSTHLHHNHNNPSKSISLFSNSVRSSSPSDSRESISPSSHVTQQSMLSPLYTQQTAGYTPSSHSHQTYSQSDYDDSTRRSPTETSLRASTDTVTYSQQSSNTSHIHSGRRSAITPPIHTHNYHPVMYRVVNEDPTPTTPPPAYASPKSPYRSHEKGLEKAFRWEASTSTQGQSSFEANVSPVISQPAADLNSTHDSPLQTNSQSHRTMHVVNQEAEVTREEPPLLPSNHSDKTISSAPGTIVGEDHREESYITERLSLSPTLDPVNGVSKPDVSVNDNFMEDLGEHSSSPTAPPRLSLHTDQDDDWSTILRFSFSGNNANLKSDNQSTTTSPLQNSSGTAPNLFTPKVNRTSRRSSIIYGPRGSPSSKEKLYHNAEPRYSSTVGTEIGILREQEESSPVIASSAIRHELTKEVYDDSANEESWADNYLDMKDGDCGDSEDVEVEDGAQEKSISGELTLTPGRNSPRGSFDSSLTRQPPSPGTTQRSLPSPSPSQHVFVTTPKAITPLSPSTSMVSPSLSPTFAMRPTSILSRRSFDLPPPLPPPEEDLPPTPEEAAAMGLVNTPPPKLTPKSTHSTQGGDITHANTRIQQDSQLAQPPAFATSSSRLGSQQPLSSLTTNIPATTYQKRDLPPVPLKVNTGVKHAHVPTSSISSTSSHNRSASGYLSNPGGLTIGRPPPLPMPPIGKVLPSVIMQQRRAAAATSDVYPPKNTTINRLSTVAANPNLTPSPSASTFSHSSKSAYSPDTSETESVSDIRKLSTTNGNSSSVRAANISSSPASLSDEAASLTPPEGDNSLECIADTRHDDLRRIHSDTWSAESKSSEESPKVNGRKNDVPLDLTEVVEPPSPSVPLTPSIAVNGRAIVTTQNSNSIPPESFQMHPIPLDLPLVLHPIKEYISIDVEPLDVFSELQEIALGQYGSVYMAQVQSQEDITATSTVAIKKVPISTKGTPKISHLKRELGLMSKIRHKHILETEALFYEPTESMLWIQMELMERSLADILALGAEGLDIQERVIARFASDILSALAYLNEQGIAHRDVRSDNLLMNGDGVLKLADLSNAIQVPQTNSIRLDIVGIQYWQAPEIRSGRYDALKIDVWSLGATVWECAEFDPPFSEVEDPNDLGVRWPPLSRADQFSKDFHDFLRLCSEPAPSRPLPGRLLRHMYIQTACPRVDVLSLLNVCRSMEEAMRNSD